MQSFDKKALVLLTAVLFTATLLNAQTFNENESIRDQLKKGTAPGLKFAPASSAAAIPVKDDISDIQKKENLITQIRKGTAPGMKFQAGGTAARTTAPAPVTQKTTKQGPLPSELDKSIALPKAGIQAVLPTQEEKPVAPAGKQ